MLYHAFNILFSAYTNGYRLLIRVHHVLRVPLGAYIHQIVMAMISRDNNRGQPLGPHSRSRSCQGRLWMTAALANNLSRPGPCCCPAPFRWSTRLCSAVIRPRPRTGTTADVLVYIYEGFFLSFIILPFLACLAERSMGEPDLGCLLPELYPCQCLHPVLPSPPTTSLQLPDQAVLGGF